MLTFAIWLIGITEHFVGRIADIQIGSPSMCVLSMRGTSSFHPLEQGNRPCTRRVVSFEYIGIFHLWSTWRKPRGRLLEGLSGISAISSPDSSLGLKPGCSEGISNASVEGSGRGRILAIPLGWRALSSSVLFLYSAVYIVQRTTSATQAMMRRTPNITPTAMAALFVPEAGLDVIEVGLGQCVADVVGASGKSCSAVGMAVGTTAVEPSTETYGPKRFVPSPLMTAMI